MYKGGSVVNFDTRKAKISLRRKLLDKRDSLSIAEIKDKSFDIKNTLFGLKEFKEAKTIMFFVSFRSEVMTDFMIREALDLGKNVVVPKVVKHSRSIQIYSVKDFYTDLSFGAYGILEPRSDVCKRAKKSDVDIVIVPGAGFTKEGDRIGYGSGYYDRFFESLPKSSLKIALAFELQIIKDIPTNEDDVPVDMIITEKSGIRCNGTG